MVVTGASTGIGAACAQYLDDRGFRVFAGVRKQADAERIAALGSARLEPLSLDVTEVEVDRGGRSDRRREVGGCGAGGARQQRRGQRRRSLECVDIGALRHQLEVNSIAPVVVTQAFLPLLRRARGRVVNVSSVNGRVASPFSGPYCMSKFALEAFTDCLRQELAEWGMHVASVQPGSIDTAMWDKARQYDWTDEATGQDLDLYGKAYRAFRAFEEANRIERGSRATR